MNIWIFQHYATPPDTLSGTRHFNFAKQLIRRGHSVTIWAAGFNHSTFKEERLSGWQLIRTENIEDVHFVWVRTPRYSCNDWRRMANIMTYGAIVSAVGCIKRPTPDVIWGSNPHLLAGLAGSMLAKRTDARFVFEVRDLWPQVFVDLGAFKEESLMIRTLRKIEEYVYDKAEKIITLMPTAFDYMDSVGISEQKVVHIPHAVDFDAFQAQGIKLPEGLARTIKRVKEEGKMIVGYIGAHGLADGLETIVDAARIVRDSGMREIHFILVGRGPEKEKVVQYAKDHNLQNMSFFDFIPKTTVPEFIRCFDVGIICKRKSNVHKYGTSFIKLFDYMACAKPIIWSVHSDDDPVQRSGAGISNDAENPEQMAESIRKIAAMNEAERKRLGESGYEYAFQNHHYDNLTDKIEQVLLGP